MARAVVLRQLFCRGSGCGVLFYICRACYRGQVYCGDECRRRMRREQRRRANRRHQQSREGRLDHRDRQRAYRERRRLRRVTDHTSAGRNRSGTIEKARVETEIRPPLAEEFKVLGGQGRFPRHRVVIRPVCIVCGRMGAKRIALERGKT